VLEPLDRLSRQSEQPPFFIVNGALEAMRVVFPRLTHPLDTRLHDCRNTKSGIGAPTLIVSGAFPGPTALLKMMESAGYKKRHVLRTKSSLSGGSSTEIRLWSPKSSLGCLWICLSIILNCRFGMMWPVGTIGVSTSPRAQVMRFSGHEILGGG